MVTMILSHEITKMESDHILTVGGLENFNLIDAKFHWIGRQSRYPKLTVDDASVDNVSHET